MKKTLKLRRQRTRKHRKTKHRIRKTKHRMSGSGPPDMVSAFKKMLNIVKLESENLSNLTKGLSKMTKAEFDEILKTTKTVMEGKSVGDFNIDKNFLMDWIRCPSLPLQTLFLSKLRIYIPKTGVKIFNKTLIDITNLAEKKPEAYTATNPYRPLKIRVGPKPTKKNTVFLNVENLAESCRFNKLATQEEIVQYIEDIRTIDNDKTIQADLDEIKKNMENIEAASLDESRLDEDEGEGNSILSSNSYNNSVTSA